MGLLTCDDRVLGQKVVHGQGLDLSAGTFHDGRLARYIVTLCSSKLRPHCHWRPHLALLLLLLLLKAILAAELALFRGSGGGIIR